MAITSPEVKAALETIFAADSEFYRDRGFQRRVGYGTRPALLVIDMANAWTRPGYAFTCDGMDTIIPATRSLLAAAREKRIPVVFTTTAYQDPTGPRSTRAVAPEDPHGDPAGRLGGGRHRRPPGPATRRSRSSSRSGPAPSTAPTWPDTCVRSGWTRSSSPG